MPEPTFTNPEVLTDYTDAVCSTSIERIVIGRNAALTQIEALLYQISDIPTRTLSIGGKTALDWVMKQDSRCGCRPMEKPETTMKTITCDPDRGKWRDLMKRSGMLLIMDAQARNQWYNSLKKDDIPVVSEANILSTFKQLRLNKGEVLQRGVINALKGLGWNLKTNSPCGSGAKITVTGLVKFDWWGFGFNHGRQCDRLADLERMLMILDGKPVPDNRTDVIHRLGDHIHENWHSNHYGDEMSVIKYFQKGAAQIVFRRPELIDKLNSIIARHQSGSTASEMRDE